MDDWASNDAGSTYNANSVIAAHANARMFCRFSFVITHEKYKKDCLAGSPFYVLKRSS
jgi:hypothetical protein